MVKDCLRPRAWRPQLPRIFPRISPRMLFCGVLPLSLSLMGCASDRNVQQLTPEDFLATAEPQPASAPVVAAPSAPASKSTAANKTAPKRSGADTEIERALDRMPKPQIVATPLAGDTAIYTVDAMVGQVNGRALYASSVLEPIADQLAALGRTLPRGVFRERATSLIASRLDQIVADALILGEAERDLSENEQMGLTQLLREKREELLRQYGRGSVSLANETMIEQTGKGLDQTLAEYRQKMLVRRYLQQKLMPKMVVSRKDVERYYNDKQSEFNPPAGRTLRLIRVTDAAAADRIESALNAGKPFAEVAGDRGNLYRRDQGGLMADVARGENIFTQDELNKAMLKLDKGQASSRITIGNAHWWVFVESIESGKPKTLRDVQLDIEETLKRQRYQSLTQRYRQRLFSEGSYNPVAQMTDSLVQVAISRYAIVTTSAAQ